MRNLKRALSLALASVMLLGMMVVGTSAASYPDVDENDNVEAIEVLNAVNVMIGDRGNFRPDAAVNRHEMAVIMAKLVLGNDVADNYVGSHPFTDTFPWADKYVAACYENDLISGRGGNLFAGNQPLTAVEAASMMLRALGYKDLNKGADDWRAPLVAMANQLRLFNGVTADPKAQLNRNQVAQLVLNTLKSYVVDLKDNTFNIADGSGAIVITGGNREYIARSSLDAFAQAISAVESKGTSASSVGGYTIELGEQLYNGDLELRDNASDDFERPSRTWIYDGKEIGTFAKEELLKASYTVGVSCRTLYDLLSRANLLDYDFNYYVDGVDGSAGANDILTRSTDNFGATGKGVLTEVYVNNARKEITIVSIHTWLAQATADYSTNRETINLKVYDGYSGTPAVTTSTTKTVDVEDVPAIKELKKDDFVLVNMTGKDRTKLEVIAVDDVEILSDSTLTRFSKNSDNDNQSDQNEALFDSLTTGGTKYDSSNRAFYSDEVLDLYNNKLLTGKTYNVYLDNYGYVIGVDLHTGEDSYVFITGYDLDSSAIASGTAKANAIFTDGTAKAIDVNVIDTNKNIEGIDGYGDGTDTADDGNETYFETWKAAGDMMNDQTYAINRWYTYTEDKGEYTLSPATRMFTTEVVKAAGDPAMVIKCNSVRLDEAPAGVGSKNGTDSEQGWVPVTEHTGAGILRAYGNDNSVFILADTGTVSLSGSDKVITGVDGVYTGVQNVEIEVTSTATADTAITDTKLHDSIYTLYDKNGYIIAAVILGDAKGGDANLVYVKTAATAEEKNGDDYYWEFDAVVDGEIETLTVKSKFKSTINNLKPGHVQEVRYDGEYVTNVVDVKTDKIYVDYTGPVNDVTVYDIGHKIADGNSTDLDCWDTHAGTGDRTDDYRLTYNGTAKKKADDLRFDGRTLYLTSVGTTNTERDQGLTFAEGAKAVVHQQIGGKWKWQEYDSVAAAIDSLGDADGDDTNGQLGFNGRLTAVLNSNGTAKWIVIHSDTDVETGSTPIQTNKLVGVENVNVGFDSRTTGNDTSWKNIMKAQADGLYQSDYMLSTWSATDAENVLFAKFTAADTTATVTIREKSSNGKVWYVENLTGLTKDSAAIFAVHVKNGGTHYATGASGDLVTKGTLPKGTYIVSITGCDPMEFTVR